MLKQTCFAFSKNVTVLPIPYFLQSRNIHYKRRKKVRIPKPKPPMNLPTDPDFYTGRTGLIRFEEFYHNTLAEDLMVMTYRHKTKEMIKAEVEERARQLQAADEAAAAALENPYLKNRPTPPPRGKKPIKPKRPPSSVKTIPQLDKIDLHCMVKESLQRKEALLNGIMTLYSITSELPAVVYSKHGVANWKLRPGMPIACKVSLKGAAMYTFLDKLIEIVLPRTREWHGLPINAGKDGNIAFGLPSQAVPLFLDIEVNYEMYPIIPGFDIIFNTTAYTNPEGRLLLSGFQMPFQSAQKR